MPRRNRRDPSAAGGLDDERARRGLPAVQTWTDGDWAVRTVPADAAVKVYRCPGCDHEIPPGLGHAVVVPRHGELQVTVAD